MSSLRVLSAAEQVAAHLRDELLRGTWSVSMPGGDRLAAELGIGRDTVEAALQLLEKEGFLVNQGRRRGRLITVPSSEQVARQIKVAILVGEDADRKLDYVVEFQHELVEAGHKAFYARKPMIELGMDVQRIARMVEHTEADAWVVFSGPRMLLEWFAAQKVPAFALFGRRRGVPMAGAGPDKLPAIAAATRALTGLGHRRIVMLTRTRRRLPAPGAYERAFLEELSAQGITPSSYHLPDWEENLKGFQARLESLFRLTPPTALIIDEVSFFVAVLQFCINRGLRVPRDVSLVCADPDPSFAWCQPPVAHIRWDSQPLARRIVQWAARVSQGKQDLRQTLTPAEFVPGGTIGPVPG